MHRRTVAAVLLAALLLGGCQHDKAAVTLDGSARYPDAEGVADSISATRLTLDGGRNYGISRSVKSFSTYNLETTPLLGRRHQYVQVGLQGDKVVWLAGIGAVVEAPGRAPTVFYIGHLLRTTGGRLIFRDGTVLRLASGVRPPVNGSQVRAEIDPGKHVVRTIVVTA